MRGAGQLGVRTEVEMVGDRGQAGSGARAHSGMEWLIPYLGTQ